jgi:hypothetical protein
VTRKSTKTDFAQLDRMKDKDIDYSDSRTINQVRNVRRYLALMPCKLGWSPFPAF